MKVYDTLHKNPNRRDIVKARKGCLEVRAKVDSQIGSSDDCVAAGTIGYVLAAHVNPMKGSEQTLWLVMWPTLCEPEFGSKEQGWPRQGYGRPITGAHDKDELEATGNRG